MKSSLVRLDLFLDIKEIGKGDLILAAAAAHPCRLAPSPIAPRLLPLSPILAGADVELIGRSPLGRTIDVRGARNAPRRVFEEAQESCIFSLIEGEGYKEPNSIGKEQGWQLPK